MWKIGDQLIFIKNGKHDSTERDGFILGEKYKIIKIDTAPNVGMPKDYADDENYLYMINGPNIFVGQTYWIEAKSFKLFKKELNSEVDYLNAFQDNFRYGG